MSDSLLLVVYGFELPDLEQVAELLEDLDLLVPGYIPPTAGLYLPESFLIDQIEEGLEFYIAPDRNLASRMMQIATGRPHADDHRAAALLMAFAQALDLHFEPSIAFHELAYKQGNEAALQELAGFRAADKENKQVWLDLALGRQPTLSFPKPQAVSFMDLAKPLKRWRRNYIAMLEIGYLELQTLTPLERIIRLIAWMEHEFFIAGPALLFAAHYFSPRFPKKRMLKQLRSSKRENALEGAANAAWDVTYVSDFVERVNSANGSNKRYLFATQDTALRAVSTALLEFAINDHSESELTQLLAQWWPAKDAPPIAAAITRLMSLAGRDRSADEQRANNFVDKLIAAGETKLSLPLSS